MQRYPTCEKIQIVFTQPRPIAAINGAEIYAWWIAAFRLQADVHFLELCIAASERKAAIDPSSIIQDRYIVILSIG